MNEILEFKKKILDIQTDILEKDSIPREFQDMIQDAFREAWYHLSLADNLITECKIFTEI